MTAVTPDAWKLTVGAKLSASPAVFAGTLEVPAGATVRFEAPLIGCEVEIAASQLFESGLSISPWSTGDTALDMTLAGISYTTNGNCPFQDGDDGAYYSSGEIMFPGVGVVDVP